MRKRQKCNGNYFQADDNNTKTCHIVFATTKLLLVIEKAWQRKQIL